MFLFKEIPDATPGGAGEVPGGRFRSHGLRRGLKDVAPGGVGGVPGGRFRSHGLRRGLEDSAATAA
jgi:hypothetical protein